MEKSTRLRQVRLLPIDRQIKERNMITEEEDEKEFEGIWQYRNPPLESDTFKALKEIAKWWFLQSRRLLREKEAKDRRYANVHEVG